MQIMSLMTALPGAAAQGLIWGIMAIGVYITFRILDIADLTVDGTLCTGGAVCIMMMLSGHNVWVSMLVATGAGLLAGLATGIFHTFMGIPAILAANVMEIKDAVALGEQIDILPVIIGVVTAAVVGFAAIKALEWLVKIDKFKIFGYYCLVLGVVVIIAGIVEKVR